MNKESASRVRIERPTVNNRQGDDTDSTGPTHARTRRHLWLWPSPVPPQRSPDVMDKLLPVIARAM